MRAIFEQELSAVGEGLLQMSRQVQTAVRDASTALAAADLQAAEQVIAADDAIDQLERELDDRCVDLLARQQPVATDLRIIVSGLRMSASIERMGDLARHVAQVTRLRYPELAIPEPARDLFAAMGEAADKAATDVVRLLETHDLELAAAVERDDDVLDHLHQQTFNLTLSPEWAGTTAQTVDVTLLARFYERFGDHAVAIARRISYLVTGDLEHLGDYNKA
ncbi:phosphate signaling complex protein PhoU [Occultella glacieicola]|uniref:Phosphate-specific transport system accessory protein PhoU n=1 Tax=Occultella glacieicola TaxID=2518684 RepID=A0ABY2E3N6_9MICO|nr:phosphate signaling complex protein PhoU [Occultella glacieicola]TDE94242.1 phosphate signaling complex protein PhoU [Occultella glacieicola]